jgi:hypothetical protein
MDSNPDGKTPDFGGDRRRCVEKKSKAHPPTPDETAGRTDNAWKAFDWGKPD